MDVVSTKVTYLYRDGSNYKQWNEVIVSGALDPDAIAHCLREGDFFIPQAVGLPALQNRFATQGYDFPTEDDHVWHEIDAIEPTLEPPTLDASAVEITQRFKDASERGWGKCLADLIAREDLNHHITPNPILRRYSNVGS